MNKDNPDYMPRAVYIVSLAAVVALTLYQLITGTI